MDSPSEIIRDPIPDPKVKKRCPNDLIELDN